MPHLTEMPESPLNVCQTAIWDEGDRMQWTIYRYCDASGGSKPAVPNTWTQLPERQFLSGNASIPLIDRQPSYWLLNQSYPKANPTIAGQIQELIIATALNKSELARVLGVSRPTLYSWLGGAIPTADNVARIAKLCGLLQEFQISSASPLFPRFVRYPLEASERSLLEILIDESVDESILRTALGRAKAVGDSVDLRAKNREEMLRKAGFEESGEMQRKTNVAINTTFRL